MEQLLNTLFTFILANKITITGLLTVLSPFIFKSITSKTFRNFVYLGFKHLLKALFKNPILTHKVFYNVERYKNMAKRITFTSIKKTNLFYILLDTKLTTTNTLILQWITNNTKLLNSSKKLELRNSLELLIINIVETYETNIKENYFKFLENREEANFYYKLSYEGLCKDTCKEFVKTNIRCAISCEDTIGFKEYHLNNISFLDRFIETIPECEGESNSQIFSYFLNYIDNALYAAVHDAKKVFTLQNGRYTTTK